MESAMTGDIEVNKQGGGKGSETEHLYPEEGTQTQENKRASRKKQRKTEQAGKKSIPAIIAAEDGVEPADNANYTDGHNIGP
jgi:hypothetical protein